MGPPYCYDDIKLTCPFCKSEMEFDTILIDQDFGMPYFIDYVCANKKCKFDIRIDFDVFNDRLPNDDVRKSDKREHQNKGEKSDAKN